LPHRRAWFIIGGAPDFFNAVNLSTEPHEKWSRLLLLGALIVALAGALIYADRFLWNSVDDSYIFMRYADNWLAGHGPVFNPGERVEGYTSFGWLAMLTGLMGLGLPGPVAAKVLAGLFGVGAVILTWLLGRRLGGKGSWAGPLAAWLVALNGSFQFWHLAGGMEAGALAVCLAGGFYLLLGREGADGRKRRGEIIGAGALFGLAYLVRPEAALFALAGLAWLVFRRDRSWRQVLIFLAPIAALVGGQLAFRLLYYGDWLPNTFYVKAGLSRRLAERGLGDLGLFLLFTAPPLACLAAVDWKKHGRGLWPMLAGTAAYWLFFVVIGGDWMVFRLLVPTLPLVFTASALGAERLLNKLPRRKLTVPVALTILLAGSWALSTFWSEPTITFGNLRYYSERLHATARWLGENADPDDTVGVTIAGVIPYFTGLETVDMLGLSDAHIAREGVKIPGLGKPGHECYDTDYVLARAPEWITLQPFPELFLSGGTPELTSELDLTRRGELWERYHLVVPRAATVTVLHRRDDRSGLARMDPAEWRDAWYFAPPYAELTGRPPPPPGP